MGNCPLGVAMSDLKRTPESSTENSKFNMNGKMSVAHALLAPALTAVGALCIFMDVSFIIWAPLLAAAAVAFALLISFTRGYVRLASVAFAILISLALGSASALACGAVLACALALTLAGRCSFRGFDSTVLLTLVLLICAALIVGLDIYAKKEGISALSIKEYIGDVQEAVRQSYVGLISELVSITIEAEGVDPEAREQLLEALATATSFSQSGLIARLVVMAVPAYFGAGITVVAYILVWAYAFVGKKLGAELKAITEPVMPRFLPVSFIVASIAEIFFSSSSAVGLSLFYFTTVLTPCFAYIGVKTVAVFIRTVQSKKAKVIIIAIIIIIAITSLGYILNLLALFGAYTLLRVAAFKDRIARK